MATVELRDGKFRVRVRTKDRYLNAVFSDKEMAEIWGKYHEELIEEMENFKVPAEKLVTLDMAIELKINDYNSNGNDKKYVCGLKALRNYFKEYLDLGLSEITYDMIAAKAKEIMETPIYVGGDRRSKTKTDSGRKVMPAIQTILNKLRCLSAVYGLMIEKGANLTNPVLPVINQIKMSEINSDNDKDQK